MSLRALALAGLLAVVASAPSHAAQLEPCADSPSARCGTVTVPAAFPRTSASAPESTPASGDGWFPAQRRAAWCAAQAVADAIKRYPLLPGTTGAGCAARAATTLRAGAEPAAARPALLRRRRGLGHRRVAPQLRRRPREDRLRRGARDLTWSLSSLDAARLTGQATRAGDSPVALQLTLPAP